MASMVTRSSEETSSVTRSTKVEAKTGLLPTQVTLVTIFRFRYRTVKMRQIGLLRLRAQLFL